MKLIKFIKKQFKDIKIGGMYILKIKVKYLVLVVRNKVKVGEKFYKLIFFFVDWPRKRFLTDFYVSDFVDFLVKKKSMPESKIDRSIIVLVMVYGKHVLLFDKVLMRSLFFRDNIPALLLQGIDVKLKIFTKLGETTSLQLIFDKYYQYFQNNSTYAQVHAPLSIEVNEVGEKDDIFKIAMAKTVAECIRTNSTMLMGAPDSFFGNGSIRNLIKMDDAGTCCVAAAHLRVNDEDFLKELDDVRGDISNSQLVGLTLKYPHQNTKISFEGIGNYSNMTGVTVSQLDDKRYVMTHRLPTVWAANFCQQDLNYFIRNPYQTWDHAWPTQLIVEGRYKVLGSSDLAFVAEVTEVNGHLVELKQSVRGKELDSYPCNSYLHKKIHEIFVVSMNAAEV